MSAALRERLRKVLELARRGVGGEKENAEVLLQKLLRRHGLTLEDLEGASEKRDAVALRWRSLDEKMLLCRLVIQLAGNVSISDYPRSKSTVFWLTKTEEVCLLIAWPVYQEAWRKAQTDLMSAFIARHDLYVPSEREHEDAELSPEQMERLHRIAQMTVGLERVERPVRRLGAGSVAEVAHG